MSVDWDAEDALFHKEMNVLVFGILVVLNALAYLSCHWSVTVNTLFTCKTEKDPFTAQFIRVIPGKHRGIAQLCQSKTIKVFLTHFRLVQMMLFRSVFKRRNIYSTLKSKSLSKFK